jgi:hypothetical protein
MLGSATAPVRPGARAGAPVHVAFRSMHSVGVPGVVLSRLNGQPVRAPVNAAPAPSRVPPHDSGTVWFATPSLAETCTPILHAGLPAHALSHQRVLLRYTDSSARVVVNNINDVADPDWSCGFRSCAKAATFRSSWIRARAACHGWPIRGPRLNHRLTDNGGHPIFIVSGAGGEAPPA